MLSPMPSPMVLAMAMVLATLPLTAVGRSLELRRPSGQGQCGWSKPPGWPLPAATDSAVSDAALLSVVSAEAAHLSVPSTSFALALVSGRGRQSGIWTTLSRN